MGVYGLPPGLLNLIILWKETAPSDELSSGGAVSQRSAYLIGLLYPSITQINTQKIRNLRNTFWRALELWIFKAGNRWVCAEIRKNLRYDGKIYENFPE